MEFAIILPENEANSILEPLLANVGFHGLVSLSSTDLGSKPFSIGYITEEIAQAFIKLYGNKRRDAFFHPSEKNENVELLLSEETVVSVFSSAMHMQTLSIIHAEFCGRGLLLTLESDAVEMRTDTIFGGFAHRKGGGEDLLFQTPYSALLAHNRAKEAAELVNNHSGNAVAYDANDIIVRKRTIQTVSAMSPWVEADIKKS